MREVNYFIFSSMDNQNFCSNFGYLVDAVRKSNGREKEKPQEEKLANPLVRVESKTSLPWKNIEEPGSSRVWESNTQTRH